MLNLSAALIAEKNKISSDGAWLVLLEIQFSGETIRLVRNTENVVWNGYTWVAFPFELEDQSEDSKGTLPAFAVNVSNVNRVIQGYIEELGGGVGATVVLRVIHSQHLDIVTADLEETFTVTDVSCTAQSVKFSLGGDFPTLRRFPPRRVMKNFCPFVYGEIECGVSAETKTTYPNCNRSLAECRVRNNSTRFGGEPAIPSGGGVYV